MESRSEEENVEGTEVLDEEKSGEGGSEGAKTLFARIEEGKRC